MNKIKNSYDAIMSLDLNSPIEPQLNLLDDDIFQEGIINIDKDDILAVCNNATKIERVQFKGDDNFQFSPEMVENINGVIVLVKGPEDLNLAGINRILEDINREFNDKDINMIFGAMVDKGNPKVNTVILAGS